MAAAPLPSPPKVFLSYSHDSPEHMDRVLALCDRLRADGIEAWIDQYETAPVEGWPRWCARRVAEADFVLVVCTEVYERRFRGDEAPGTGLGVRWEGYVVFQELYDAGALNEKYIPVLWPPAGKEQIPLVLRGGTRYDLSGADVYQDLYRHLTGQPKTPAPPLGSLVPMPPQERRARFSPTLEPRYEDDHSRRLGEELAAARQQFKDLSIAGQNVTDVREQILGLRRAMREGGRLQPGDHLAEERFHLLEIVGRGGFATVWKAWDEKRQRLVAVKVLHGLHAEDRTRRERFFRGARKMLELVDHPGIVRVIEAELEESGRHFFVMDYVGGGDLRRAVLAGELPQEKVLPIILAVGEALAFAHEKGIIHRDVKPANILLDGDRPKLTDFDLVRALDTTGGTQTQGHLGTMLYSAPEMLGDAKGASATADVYSLAMTAIFSFHGKDLPLDVLRRPEALLEKLPCSPAIRKVLSRGISWEPEERPRSVAVLCEELRLDAQVVASGSRGPAPGEKRLHTADGTMLLYVPGGEYPLGAEDIGENEKPVHLVILSPYWIAKYPVTNEQYGRFLKANPGAHEPQYWADNQFNQPDQPVVGVSWEEAQSYCRWAGLRLPSEAQWEAAARGPDGRRYPWGKDEPTPEHANFRGGKGGTTPVGSYQKGSGPFGALDQAGNVWEWCEDVWDAAAYRKRAGQRDPVATTGDPAVRCLRGGSWADDAGDLPAAYRDRDRASVRSWNVGFRCLLPAVPER